MELRNDDGSADSFASAEANDFSLNCECGKGHRIHEGQAGHRLQCRCGRTLEIPSLHVLRRRAGLSPMRINAAKRIEELVQAGELPEGDRCVCCFDETQEVLRAWAICEQITVITEEMRVGGLTVTEREVARHGRSVAPPVPIRMCSACQRHILGWVAYVWPCLAAVLFATVGVVFLVFEQLAPGVAFVAVAAVSAIVGVIWITRRQQQTLKDLLCKTPIYKELLAKYPHATLTTAV